MRSPREQVLDVGQAGRTVDRVQGLQVVADDGQRHVDVGECPDDATDRLRVGEGHVGRQGEDRLVEAGQYGSQACQR